MDGLRRTDGRKVAVALIGEHNVLRLCALDACCDRLGSAVRRLHHIAGEIIVAHNGAADRGHADRFAVNAELFYRFRNKAVNDAVRTAGAIMQRRVC